MDLEQAIGTTAPQLIGSFGWVVLRFHSPVSGNLYAALMVHNMGHPFTFHIDASAELQGYQVVSREGVWWLPKGTSSDYLILTNQGGFNLPVDLSFYDATGKESKQRAVLGSRQTIRYSVRQLITAAKLNGIYGGIRYLLPPKSTPARSLSHDSGDSGDQPNPVSRYYRTSEAEFIRFDHNPCGA